MHCHRVAGGPSPRWAPCRTLLRSYASTRREHCRSGFPSPNVALQGLGTMSSPRTVRELLRASASSHDVWVASLQGCQFFLELSGDPLWGSVWSSFTSPQGFKLRTLVRAQTHRVVSLAPASPVLVLPR